MFTFPVTVVWCFHFIFSIYTEQELHVVSLNTNKQNEKFTWILLTSDTVAKDFTLPTSYSELLIVLTQPTNNNRTLYNVTISKPFIDSASAGTNKHTNGICILMDANDDKVIYYFHKKNATTITISKDYDSYGYSVYYR